ncbi:unnamed protein product [Rhizophagus irregularis]|uniref:Uncharacterized protein n=1 Tax=Rhizophagus irregularis TaxID=588596 RepID=A0A916DXC1_9GLOM|nr:unnamed protein product [Rhizophagus irregularis]
MSIVRLQCFGNVLKIIYGPQPSIVWKIAKHGARGLQLKNVVLERLRYEGVCREKRGSLHYKAGLSTEYVNSTIPMLWRCGKEAKEIAHSRDDFLKIHSQGLELDIYYLQYGFAIEVQGKQHEEWDCSHCTKKLVRIISFDMAVYLENACTAKL